MKNNKNLNHIHNLTTSPMFLLFISVSSTTLFLFNNYIPYISNLSSTFYFTGTIGWIGLLWLRLNPTQNHISKSLRLQLRMARPIHVSGIEHISKLNAKSVINMVKKILLICLVILGISYLSIPLIPSYLEIIGPIVGLGTVSLLYLLFYASHAKKNNKQYSTGRLTWGNKRLTQLISNLSILCFFFASLFKIGVPGQTPDTTQYISRGYAYLADTWGIEGPLETFRLVYNLPVTDMTGTPGVTTTVTSLVMTKLIGPIVGPVVASRIGTVLWLTGFLWLSKWIISYIWTREIAMWTILFLSFNPYFLAFARIINPDSILPAFSFLAVLLFYLSVNRSKKYLYPFIVVFSLAILTKITALIFCVSFAVWYFIRSPNEKRLHIHIKNRILNYDGWVFGGAIVTSIFVASIFWPELYNGFSGFQSFLITILKGSSTYSSSATSTTWPVLSVLTKGWPDAFYFILFLVRLPVTVLSLALIGISVSISDKIKDKNLLILLSFLIVFLFISNAEKKGDKYHLFLYPFIMLLAAIGMTELRKRINKSVLILIVLVTILPALVYSPYYFESYNSFSGYGENIDKFYPAGWGDGHKEAAQYIKRNYQQTPKILVLGYGGIIDQWYNGEVSGLDPSRSVQSLKNEGSLVVFCYNFHTKIQYSEKNNNICKELRYKKKPMKEIRINNVHLADLYDFV